MAIKKKDNKETDNKEDDNTYQLIKKTKNENQYVPISAVVLGLKEQIKPTQDEGYSIRNVENNVKVGPILILQKTETTIYCTL